MSIKELTDLFNDGMTLNEVSNKVNCPIQDILDFGTSWGYDFKDWSIRNLNKRLANLSKEELICLIIKSNII